LERRRCLFTAKQLYRFALLAGEVDSALQKSDDMPWTHAGSAVVVIAQQFNPTVVSQLWLVRHGLIGENDVQEGSIFSDAFVQLASPQFNLLLLPNQLQFVPLESAGTQQALVLAKVGTIVRELPHTPFRGLGLNFNWHLTAPDADMNTLTREMFSVPERPLYQQFATADARFGAYLSKDYAGFRLKLDIKPVVVPLPEAGEHRLQFAFNFHCDIGENGSAQIESQLARWNDARDEAERIINAVEARQIE
jgi:hypothetical protein